MVLVLTLASLVYAGTRFNDVPQDHPYYAAIDELAAAGIIEGYANQLFGPDDPVTRQQFAKMIVLTAGYDVSEADVCPYRDVVKGGSSTLYPDNYIAVCASEGIAVGGSDRLFHPFRNITRYQVVSMVVRVADDLAPGIVVAPPAGWNGNSVWVTDPTHGQNARRAEYNGLLSGFDLDTLNPQADATRAEVAYLLSSLLDMVSGPRTVEATIYCRGDGVHDDTSGIAAAMSACRSGDTLHFAAGTYLGDMTCKRGVTIEGDGPASWVKGRVKPASDTTFKYLKMGRSGKGWGTAAGMDVHDVTCQSCTFVGGGGEPAISLGGACELAHDIRFVDCIIERSSGQTNGVSINGYGLPDGNAYNIEFRDCHFMGSGRMNFEVCGYSEESASIYPMHDINLIGCVFEPSDSTSVSYAMNRMHDGTWRSGSSVISDCIIKDAGVDDDNGQGTHGIELTGPVNMTVTGNTVTGSHVVAMLLMNCGDGKWHENGPSRSYNVISGNTFDGRASARSYIILGGSNWTFTGNTCYARNATQIWNATESKVPDNVFKNFAADGGLNRNGAAMFIYDSDRITLEDNLFGSRYSSSVILSRDYSHPTGPATNIVFADNVFENDAGNSTVSVGTGCSAIETGSVWVAPGNHQD